MKFIGIIIVAMMLFVSNVSAATNVTATWANYSTVRVTWNFSTQATKGCIYRNDGTRMIFLDCEQRTGPTQIYEKPANGDVAYASVEGDVYCVEEYNKNTIIGFTCSNALGKRPPKYITILPIVVR